MGWIEGFAKEEAERMARYDDAVANAKTAADKLQAANDNCLDITTPAEGLAAAQEGISGFRGHLTKFFYID